MSYLNSLPALLAKQVLSPGERTCMRNLVTEIGISRQHRRGLRAVHRRGLGRPLKLNLGSGAFCKSGYLNIDLDPNADLSLDLRRPLPFASGCCEFIFSEHFFEHLTYPGEISSLWRECLRVLRPGGLLRFSVPDTEWPLIDYRDGEAASYFQACRVHDWHPRECTTRMEHINYHFRQRGRHLFAYDFETAKKLLESIGFDEVRREEFDPTIDSEHRRVGSLFILAKKPLQRS